MLLRIIYTMKESIRFVDPVKFSKLLTREERNIHRAKTFAIILLQIMRHEKRKNSTIYINMYRVRHGCWQHIFDSPAAIIRNLLARIPNGARMPAAIRSTTYKSRSKDVFGFMDVLIFARRREPVSLRHLCR